MSAPLQAAWQGMRDALPVTLTFSILFVAVGAASHAGGLDLAQGLAMTALVFAAPAQFAAVDLIADRAWLAAVLAIAVINFRFLLMAVAISPYLGRPPKAALFASLQMLSASTFATAFTRLQSSRLEHPFAFYLGVCAGAFPTALAATALGYYVQDNTPPWLQELMAMLLPVYFATFLAKAWPRARFLAAGVLGFLLKPIANGLLPGFGLMLAALAAAAFLLLLEPRPCPTTR